MWANLIAQQLGPIGQSDIGKCPELDPVLKFPDRPWTFAARTTPDYSRGTLESGVKLSANASGLQQIRHLLQASHGG